MYVTGHLPNTFPNFVLIVIIRACDLLGGSPPHSLVQSFAQSHGEKPAGSKHSELLAAWHWAGHPSGGAAQVCCSGAHIPVGYRRGHAPLHRLAWPSAVASVRQTRDFRACTTQPGVQQCHCATPGTAGTFCHQKSLSHYTAIQSPLREQEGHFVGWGDGGHSASFVTRNVSDPRTPRCRTVTLNQTVEVLC